MGLDPAFVLARVGELTSAAADAFAEAAPDPEVVALQRDLPGRLVDMIAARAAHRAKLLESGPTQAD
jgi:hypothetical protein